MFSEGEKNILGGVKFEIDGTSSLLIKVLKNGTLKSFNVLIDLKFF